MYTIEQLEILMLIAESTDPMETALRLHRHWTLCRAVAEGTLRPAVPHLVELCVLKAPERYACKARLILSAIDEWLAENTRRESA